MHSDCPHTSSRPFQPNPGTTPTTILAVNSDHGLSFAGEETRTMVWVSFSLQIYSTIEFWRFEFSVVWVSSFYGDGGGGAEGPGGCLGNFGGGGLNILFRGQNIHQEGQFWGAPCQWTYSLRRQITDQPFIVSAIGQVIIYRLLALPRIMLGKFLLQES